MSRAFISESNNDFMDSDIPEVKYPLPEGTKNYMTPDGAERIKKELDELSRVRRPDLLARIASAVNADGGGGERVLNDRRKLRAVERRIEYLKKMIDTLVVVEPGILDKNHVHFGALVTVDEQNAGRKTYRIVGVDESDPEKGRISWHSPLARALTGRKTGETVIVHIPAGKMKLTIKRIEYDL